MDEPFDLLRVHAEASKGHDEQTEPTGELILHGSGSGTRPRMPLMVSVSGHTDAGALSEQLAESLLKALPHTLVASFEVDDLFDYRSRRPQVTFAESAFSDFQGPRLDLYEIKDAMGRPFLVLTGDEPDFQWERVAETVINLVDHLDVSLMVLVDALGLPTPHTRPVGVTAHGNRPDLIDGISTWSPQAQIEAGLVQMLEMRAAEAGHDVVGYTLHVPHYLAAGKYPQVAVAALEYAGAACELMLPSDELREAARAVDQDITRQVSVSDDVSQLVQRLEASYDKHATGAQRSLLVKHDDDVPDADELGAAVEEFLRAQPEPAVDHMLQPGLSFPADAPEATEDKGESAEGDQDPQSTSLSDSAAESDVTPPRGEESDETEDDGA